MGGDADTLRAAGNHALAAGRAEEALRLYAQAAAATREDPRPLGNRSAALAGLGRYEEALADADAALRLRPRWAKGHARRGLALFYLGRSAEALAAYEAGLEICGGTDSRHPAAGLLAAGAAQVRAARAEGGGGGGARDCAPGGAPGGASGGTAAAAGGTISDPEAAAARARGTAAFARRDFAAADRAYSEALSLLLRPGSSSGTATCTAAAAPAWCGVGADEGAGGGEEAVAAVAAAAAGARRFKLMSTPPSPSDSPPADRGSIAGGGPSSDRDRDRDHYCNALALEAAALLSNRSAARAGAGAWRGALADGRRAAALRPGWPKAHSRVALAATELRDYPAARAAYDRAIALTLSESDGSQTKDRRDRGDRAGGDGGRPSPGDDGGDGGGAAAAAIASLREGLARVGRAAAADAAAAAAAAAFAAGRFEEAEAGYSSALETFPSDAKLRSNRSAARGHLGRWEGALADASEALRLAPRWCKAHGRVGAAMMGLREPEAAYSAYVRGLRQADGDPAGAAALRAGAAQALAALAAPGRAAGGGPSGYRDSRRGDARAARALPSRGALPPKDAVRVFAVSDVHVDQHSNIVWARQLSPAAYKGDVLIVAGDVGDTANAVRIALRELRPKFRRLVYLPGNHDLWVRPDLEAAQFADSIEKLLALESLCDELDVDWGLAEVAQGLYVVPLQSWYTSAFDVRDPAPGKLRFDKFATFPHLPTPATTRGGAGADVGRFGFGGVAMAVAGSGLDPDAAVASALLALNLPALAYLRARRGTGAEFESTRPIDLSGLSLAGSSDRDIDPVRTEEPPTVLTASHFLPRPELPVPVGAAPEMAKAVGCLELEDQIRAMHSVTHVYGHTHINGECAMENVNYVQYALEAAAGGHRAPLYCVWERGQRSGRLVREGD